MTDYLCQMYHLDITKDNVSRVIEAHVKRYFEAFSREVVFEHTCEVRAVYDEIITSMNVSDLIIEQGKIAVLLHDVGRVVDYTDIVEFCENHGKPVSQSELKALGILHQFASKIIAKQVFGIEDTTILNAIECHTTLKANPSIVDKLVFLSDKLSWKEAEMADLIYRMKTKLKYNVEDSLDLALFEYQKDMYDKRESMPCYHDWSLEAYHYLNEKILEKAHGKY